jgi:hypothetical protein
MPANYYYVLNARRSNKVSAWLSVFFLLRFKDSLKFKDQARQKQLETLTMKFLTLVEVINCFLNLITL